MKINILNEPLLTPWMIDYVRLYTKHITALGHEVVSVSPEQAADLGPEDFLIFPSHKSYHKIDTKARKIGQVNATSLNPFFADPTPKQEQADCEYLDAVIVFDDEAKMWHEARFPSAKALTCGFPVDYLEIQRALDICNKQGIKKVSKSIVVSGRCSEGKQLILTAYILRDLVSIGYTVTFCFRDSSTTGPDHTQLFRQMGIKVLNCTHEQFMDELFKSDIYFTASLEDCYSVAMVEAAAAGCYIVAPMLKDLYPVTSRVMYGGLYEPFSRSNASWAIGKKPEQTFDFSLYNPASCAEKLIKQLEAWE